jgi:hypothetical protein
MFELPPASVKGSKYKCKRVHQFESGEGPQRKAKKTTTITNHWKDNTGGSDVKQVSPMYIVR